MKKIIIIVLLLVISIFNIGGKSFALQSQSSQKALEAVENQGLTIRQAIELAYQPAHKWNKDVQLLDAINIDLDKPGKSIGSSGKRKHWNISFGVPDTNKSLLVTIHHGKIDEINDLTSKGTAPYPKKEFIAINKIKYDSPELLKKALKMGGIYPGRVWAKGYNFMLIKDTERNIDLLLVIGWNHDQKKMKAVGFDAATGKYIPPQNLISFAIYLI